MLITNLTESGKAVNAAISPDGRFVVYVLSEKEKESLWMRQVAAESAVQILPPEPMLIYGITFSPDGNFIYLQRGERNSANSDLYRMPALGGTTNGWFMTLIQL